MRNAGGAAHFTQIPLLSRSSLRPPASRSDCLRDQYSMALRELQEKGNRSGFPLRFMVVTV